MVSDSSSCSLTFRLVDNKCRIVRLTRRYELSRFIRVVAAAAATAWSSEELVVD